MIFNAIQFLKDFDIPFMVDHPKVSAGWVGFCCPFCHDHNYKAAFNIDRGYAHCWVCGKLGTLDTVTALTGSSYVESKHIFSKYLGNPTHVMRKHVKAHGMASSIPLPSGEFTQRESKYIKKRMLSSRVAEYDLRGGGVVGRWAFRLVFPITLHGEVVSATGRALHEDMDLRYYTLPPSEEVVCHKSLLLNEDKIGGEHAVLVEGVIDSIRGGAGFVSSFGLSLTDEQLMRLTKYRKISILPDMEEQAYKAWSILGDTLCALGVPCVEVLRLHGRKDVGDMPDDEIADLRKEIGL